MKPHAAGADEHGLDARVTQLRKALPSPPFRKRAKFGQKVFEWSGLLPFVSLLTQVAGWTAIAAALAAVLWSAGHVGLAASALPLSLAFALAWNRLSIDEAVRVAVIGSQRSADLLADELPLVKKTPYVVVGRIDTSMAAADAGIAAPQEGLVPCLGSLPDLGTVVQRDQVDLLVMTADVPRLAVFDEVSRTCLHLPVRLREAANFYENAFGHVPVGEINASWFQYIMHPRFRHTSPLRKRVLDLVVAVPAFLAFLPLLVVAGVLIRRDGGPLFFTQPRVGEGGRKFKIYKLRTMRVDSGTAWASADDDRVTPIGRILRRTHLDEVPQLLNVFRGEMSLVGPRPEQVHFVEELERVIPFYSRRHLVKPGMTGWAQVRCGYAGSHIGTMWKVSHDLFYLKHRSLKLDLAILAETVRMLFADSQYSAEPAGMGFLRRDNEEPALEHSAA